MPAKAWATLFIATLIIGVTAVALIRIIVHLVVIRKTLGTVVVGALVIANQTKPVGPAIESVNASLKPVRDFCESV